MHRTRRMGAGMSSKSAPVSPDPNTDAGVAELAEAWLRGICQSDLAERAGLNSSPLISQRFMKFVNKYQPGRDFRYAERRKTAMRDALAIYYKRATEQATDPLVAHA